MTALATFLAPVLRRISTAALWLAAAGLVLVTVIIGWQIFARYVLNDTPVWSERLSIFLMTWYILLAAAVGVREGFHIGLVVLRDNLPKLPRTILAGVSDVAIAVFGLAMIVYGGELAERTLTHTIPTLGVSTAWSYAPFPVAGALIILFCLERLVTRLAGQAPDSDRLYAPGGADAERDDAATDEAAR